MVKTKKIVTNELKEYGLQTKLLLSYFVVHLILTPICIIIIYYAVEGNNFIKLFALLSIIYLVFLFFFPTIIAFDFLQNYKEDNIPKLKHPFRWIIFSNSSFVINPFCLNTSNSSICSDKLKFILFSFLLVSFNINFLNDFFD